MKNDKEEKIEEDEEELAAIKRKEKIFDWLWSQEEQQTIAGLLKGRKIKKEKNMT